ncbi:MAG: hypothetical protein HY901_05910 [Deltaproteobacteria bacterium]|nr:hypothetical protein [Deltaproteobacteria bacterium]
MGPATRLLHGCIQLAEACQSWGCGVGEKYDSTNAMSRAPNDGLQRGRATERTAAPSGTGSGCHPEHDSRDSVRPERWGEQCEPRSRGGPSTPLPPLRGGSYARGDRIPASDAQDGIHSRGTDEGSNGPGSSWLQQGQVLTWKRIGTAAGDDDGTCWPGAPNIGAY